MGGQNMNKPPLLPPAGSKSYPKVPGEFLPDDTNLTNQKMMERAGVKHAA